MKIKIFFLSSSLFITLLFSPIAAFADHNDFHTIQQLQSQLASLQQAFFALLAAAANPAQPSQGTGTAAQPAVPAKKAATTTISTTPVTPAVPAIPTTPAQPYPGTGQPAQPAIPAQQAVPAQPQSTTLRQPAPQAELCSTCLQPTGAEQKEVIRNLQTQINEVRGQIVRQLQNNIRSLQTQVTELQSKRQAISGGQEVAPAPEVAFTRSLRRGLSGDDVKQLQGFLKQFPDVYPQGLATGFFGSLTEQAIRKLQEKFGLETTGAVGPKTVERIETLQHALNRKNPPKLTEILPASGSLGSSIVITGSGFTEHNNSVFIRGAIVRNDIESSDGKTLEFSLPEHIPCQYVIDANDANKGNACPIKVVNANGISNAKPFKVTGAYVVPPSDVVPQPAQVDTMPPLRTNGLPSGSLLAGTTQTVLSLVTDENATCKYAAAAETVYDSIISLFSTSGGTSHSTTLAGLENGKTYDYYIRCQDNAGNANTDDFVVSFGVATPPPPPELISISPAILVKGEFVTLNGAGFTSVNNTVIFAGSFDKQNEVVSGVASPDGSTLHVGIPLTMPCNVVSECSVFVNNQNGTSNRVTFLLGQKVDPVTVLTPNGGEQALQNTGITISANGGTSEAFSGDVSVSYALVDQSATTASDPSEFILGWIAHMSLNTSVYAWDAIKLCDWDNANSALPETGSCWKVEPGNYKILVVGKDELNQPTIWDSATGKPGNIDISDAPFTILPAPLLTVVSPNGGEKLVYGTQAIITWDATSVLGKTVHIRLLKGGSAYYTIAANVAMGNESGIFTYTWTIPSTLPMGSDYTVEVSDAANASLRDTSDAPFSVVPVPTISVTAPNGGENWFRGYTGTVKWSAGNILSKTVTIKLFKGGLFLRTLVENISQAYNWSTTSYIGGSFSYNITVPADIPAGSDYTIEVSDASDPTVHDTSNAPFSILQVPDPATFTGRLTDRFSGKALSNTWLYGSEGASYTGANGEFSVSTKTSDIINLYQTKTPVASWPLCYANWSQMLQKQQTQMSLGNLLFDLQPNTSTSLINSVNNLGDVPMWPMIDLAFNSDTSLRAFVNYPDSGYYAGSPAGGVNSAAYEVRILALNTDLAVKLWDSAGNVYYAPSIKIGLENACTPKTLSYYGGQFKWEPYSILITPAYANLLSGTIGKTFSQTFSASGGTAPYTWTVGYGSLPSWLTLNVATGVLSGTPTSAGMYEFTVKTVDANGVSAARYVKINVN